VTDRPIVAVLHPGAMGSSVGAALAGRARAVCALDGRSAATRARAAADGLEDLGDEATLAREADVLISVCPPHAAGELAARVTALGFRGCYVDANAVAPETARRIAAVVEAVGADFVDGGIVGPPARHRGLTRLWLSGSRAPEIAALFTDSALETALLDDRPGSASALKMAFAAWTKGTTALLAAIRALADAEGVSDGLFEQWRILLPELAEGSDARIAGTLPKAWRFVGEMEEIARTFADRGLPDGFHLAAAEVYDRMARARAAGEDTVEATLARLPEENEGEERP
jgi:hypothetical protein